MKRPWIWILIALAVVDIAVFLWWRDVKLNKRYRSEIVAASQRYQVSPSLIRAIIWRESRFQANARGAAGEIGLMQIREPAAFEWAAAENIHPFAHETLSNPGSNVLAGTWYLRKLMDRYENTDDPLPYALADYNAGRTHVLRWAEGAAQTNSAAFIESITYPGTKDYIRSVLGRIR